MDDFIFALGYTILMLIMSFVYWKKGRQQGIDETVAIMKLFEPEATFRLKTTLESKTNDSNIK